MKKPFPIGDKIAQLINEAVDEYTDVPNVPFDGDFKTQVPLAGLPKGGYGYTKGDTYNEEDDTPIIPDKKKRKFIEELPPEENFENLDDDEIDWKDGDEFDDEDDIDWKDESDDEEELDEQKKVDEEPEEDLSDYDPASDSELGGTEKSPGSQQPDQDPNAMIDPGGTGGADDEPQEDPNVQPSNSVDTNADPNTMPQQGMMGAGTDPNIAGGDPNAMGGGMDPNAAGGMMPGGDPNAMGGMGMGGPVPKTAEEIGRIFELKKIYARLLAVEEHLSFSADDLLLKLRDFVSKAIELFETLISNIDTFKDQIDEIIVMFYKFLEYVYSIMHRYYKVKEKQDQKQVDKSKLFTTFPDENKKELNRHSATTMFRLNM